ncbi:iron-sulfur cluster assembly scaffold protein [Desulfolutivibrio sp.]|uniref:iron-sulfur cluster assembly scaffold protein n=1 Tax=Desulfolutivibrio sp. TaxID=2773296 RepID=UPI002F96B441
MSDFDRLAEELQAMCDADAVAYFGEAVVARWKAPRHVGVMFDPSAMATVSGACDDTITLFLRIAEGRISEASFYADGCASSVVCADAAVELALGKSPGQAAAMQAEDILELLGGLPKDKRKSARIAAKAVQMAVADYLSRHR